MAKKTFVFHLLRRHRSGPMLYRDLSVNTDAALQEVALKISEQLNSLIWFRDDHIHCIRQETDFHLPTDVYSFPVKKERNIPA